jgi:hypothetical protein
LRAGLLSQQEVIHRLNKGFVCTTIIIDDAKKRANGGDELAKQLAAQWEYPLEMMFLTPTGTLISKLNSYKDFPGTHPDVAAPAEMNVLLSDVRSHADIFLKHIAHHFGI